MIRIISVGKLKEKYLVDAVNEYKKRLSKYTKLDLIEVSDESFDDIEKVKDKECAKISKYIDDKDYVIVLDINGEELSSIELSQRIESIFNVNSNIDFVIGGSYGLSNGILNRANYRLSFSKLTFPHQLFRVILLEQLYRSFKIMNNESYHK